MDIRPRIICGFPGVGKSTLVRKLREKDFPILDSDSSTFDKSQFPQNYIEAIKNAINNGYWVLVSTHAEVRQALVKEGLEYVLVRPKDIRYKDEYMRRYRERGSPEAFLKLMDAKWEEFFKDVESDKFGMIYTLDEKQYLVAIEPELLDAHRRDKVTTFEFHDLPGVSIDIGAPNQSLDYMDGFYLGRIFTDLGHQAAALKAGTSKERGATYIVPKRMVPLCRQVATALNVEFEDYPSLGAHARHVSFTFKRD